MKTKKRRDITIIVSHRFFLYFVQCLGILGAVFHTRVFFFLPISVQCPACHPLISFKIFFAVARSIVPLCFSFSATRSISLPEAPALMASDLACRAICPF